MYYLELTYANGQIAESHNFKTRADARAMRGFYLCYTEGPFTVMRAVVRKR